jgi:hypothetical protein
MVVVVVLVLAEHGGGVPLDDEQETAGCGGRAVLDGQGVAPGGRAPTHMLQDCRKADLDMRFQYGTPIGTRLWAESSLSISTMAHTPLGSSSK